MSLNRENIIWQSPNGSWNRAFYEFYSTPQGDGEDHDHEWDVEYTDDFNWVSVGHASEDDANASWRGENPGGNEFMDFNPENAERIEQLDQKAKAFLQEKAARRSVRSSGPSF